MSTTPNDPTLEALAARVAALEQALASTMIEKPTDTRRFLRRAVVAASSLLGALLKVSSMTAFAAENNLPGKSNPCVCSSAEATVPAVKATGTNGAHGVVISSDIGIGLSATCDGNIAVSGQSTRGFGVLGVSDSNVGVRGQSTSNVGVYGRSTGYRGIQGESTSEIGVCGQSTSYIGVRGDGNVGVHGQSPTGVGVRGVSDSNAGVSGQSESGTGVQGQSTSSFGVFGSSDSSSGVSGQSTHGVGVSGVSTSNIGVIGTSDSSSGVYGQSDSYTGVRGYSHSGIGVFGESPSGYAGWFDGTVQVSGQLHKSGGGFQIDHPLDAAHKYLSHSFVESPDMKNLYDGLVTLDANGQAEVRLPAWFEMLNTDVRYQLTCLGSYAPVYIAEKLQHHLFTIAGGLAGMEVCWQVTGIRQDRWANAHRIAVEQDKPAQEQDAILNFV